MIRLMLAGALLFGSLELVAAQTTLRVGDQKGNSQAVMEAAGVLKDVPYKIEWKEFAAAAPLLEALGAGAIETGLVGDAPFTFAAAANVPVKAIGAIRQTREGLAVLKTLSAERANVAHRDASGLAHAARGMLTQRDASVIETLPHIKVPSLVVVGADDTPFLAASDYMAAKIPAARKVVIPSAGHAANIDQPQLFNDAVVAFLADLESGSPQRAAS